MRIELGAGATALVVDVAMGEHAKRDIVALHEQVGGGHAEAPVRAADDALHIVYRPSDVGALVGYTVLERAGIAIEMPNLSSQDRKRIAAAAAKEASTVMALVGPSATPAFERVEVFGRRAAGTLVFEVRATPGPASTVPPADAWRPSPSVAPDGPEPFVTYSRALVSAWKLGGEPAGVSFDDSPVTGVVRREGLLAVLAALPTGIPVFARLSMPTTGIPERAFGRFERLGLIVSADRSEVDFGLLAEVADARASSRASRCATPPSVPFQCARRRVR